MDIWRPALGFDIFVGTHDTDAARGESSILSIRLEVWAKTGMTTLRSVYSKPIG